MLGRGFWELFPTLRGTRFETELRRAMAYQIGVHLEDYFPAYDIWLDLNTGTTSTVWRSYSAMLRKRRFNEQLRQNTKARKPRRAGRDVAHDFNNLLTVSSGTRAWPSRSILNNPARKMLAT